MTNIYTTSDLHSPAPKRPSFLHRHRAGLIVGVAALILGVGIGAAGEPEPVTIEKEVPGPERIVTKTVEVTPEACLTALDLNEQAFTLLSSSMSSILDGDLAAANTSTGAVKAMVPKVNTAKAECRAGAK